MAVVGNYTPVTNWSIVTVFTPDAAMDDSDKRGVTIWEFQNANFYHALIFTAFKWEWRTEQLVAGNWVKKWIDFDLDGVADTPFGYSYYKENLVPITITTVYDYTNQKRRIYVDGYLLVTDNQNIPQINQSLQLSIYTGVASDRFYGTINSCAYGATAPSPTPLQNPTPVPILTSYNKKYLPYSQNWIPVDDILIQYQNWPNPQFNITTNCWVEAAYDIQYFAGFNGNTPVSAGVLAKMLLIQALLSSNKWRHSIRAAVLQSAWSDKSTVPNTWTTLIGFANANPLVRTILGASVAQVVAIPPNTQPDLHTIPIGTPNTTLTGLRNTFYQQAQYIVSLLTRPVNGTYVDDEELSTNTNLQIWPNPAGVNSYIQWINYMFGSPPASNPNTFRSSFAPNMEFIIYDMFDLEHCVSLNQFPVNPLINVNSTGNASISAYTAATYVGVCNQKFWYLHQGNIRSLRFYLVSKYYEIQAGRQLNQAFVAGGFQTEEESMRPGPFLGLLKMYKVCGTERFFSAYFTPSAIGIQNPKAYCWQAAAASYAEAIFTPPQYRNILLFGTLLDGDVLQFPTNPASPPLYLFNTGNKLIACCARKYNGEYLIACTYQPLNNFEGQPISKSITVNIDGNVLTLTARKQGSVYHRAVDGTLTWIDQWHEDTHFDWWGNVIINPNLNTDMAGINDLHNGLGYIYKTDLTNPNPVIVGLQRNDEQGEREMRRQGLSDAPIGADSSSTGLIQITNVAGVGNITTIVIDGTDILNGNPYAISSAVPATEAIGLALWINGIVPASGYQYFAYAVGDFVYLSSPIDVGVGTNDLTITVTADNVSIVTVTTPFFNGTAATDVFDNVTGYRYFLNADYDANGVSGGLPAPPDSLTNAYDITKWMITRGNNSGMMMKDFTLASDSIVSADRGSQNMLLSLSGEGGASDVLVFIGTAGFVQGDLVYLKNALAGTTITIESAPVTTSISPFKNIYLSQDQPYDLTDQLNTMLLQYTYDATRGGGIFVEITRSFVYVPPPDDCVFWSGTYATAAALAGANGLKPCASYKITDRGDNGIQLRANNVSSFERNATYFAVYGGTGQIPSNRLEQCEYDFENDKVNWRYEDGIVDPNGLDGGPYVRGNNVRNDFYDINTYFPFGYVAVYQNTIDNSIFVIGGGVDKSTLSIQTNTLINSTSITINGDSVSVVNNNIINSDGNITLAANGILQANNVLHGGQIDVAAAASISICIFERCAGISVNAGITVENCSFINTGNYILPQFVIGNNYSYKSINNKISTFDATINPSAAKYIVMGDNAICGIVNISSIAASSQIDAILYSTTSGHEYDVLYHNITLRPNSGISVDIRDFSVASAGLKNTYLGDSVGATTLTLNGTKGDWAEFAFNQSTNKWYLVNFQTYP